MARQIVRGEWRGRLRLQMEAADWPPVDQRLWAAATVAGSILDDDGGKAAAWSPATQRTVKKAYGRWLAWLVEGNLLDPVTPPLARVTMPRVAAYVAMLRQSQTSATVCSYAQGLAMMLDVLVPGGDTRWLWDAINRLKGTVTPSGRKRDRIVPSSELFDYGVALMDEALSTVDMAALALAAQFRDGLMIALLASRPVRMRNFVSIEIGRHLMPSGEGYRLRFEAAETKTHREIDVAFPQTLVGHLNHYLTRVRPALLSQHDGRRFPDRLHADAGLWVTSWGTRMSEPTLHAKIVALTRKRFGKSINPHLFRDCAATSIAVTDPSHMAITLQVLGHATLSTSERFYNHAMSNKASQAYQAEIAAMRRQATRCMSGPGHRRKRLHLG